MYDLSSPEFITWQSWATAEVGQLIRTTESTAPHPPDQATLDFQPKEQAAQGDRTQVSTILEKIYADHGPLILQLGGHDETQRIWIHFKKPLAPDPVENNSSSGTAEHATDRREELVYVLWITPRGVGRFSKM